MLQITTGSNTAIVRGDCGLAVSMLEAMYKDSLLQLVRSESVVEAFEHEGHAWIVQEFDGWVALECVVADQYVMSDLFSHAEKLVTERSYSVYFKSAENEKFRRGASPNAIAFGVYEPLNGEYQFISKSWFMGEWDIYQTPKVDQIPIDVEKLSKDTVESFFKTMGIPLSFGGLAKTSPMIFICKNIEKTDEEWAEYFQNFFTDDKK